MIRTFFCVLLTLTLALTAAADSGIPRDIQNNFFDGRSGSILLRPIDGGSTFESYLVMESSLLSGFTDGIPETSIGDLLAHTLGALPLTPNVDRTGFPRTNIWNLPKAVVLFALDSLSPEEIRQLNFGSEFSSVRVLADAYPHDLIASVTSALTGSYPSEHGIVGFGWPTPRGPVLAYSSDVSMPIVGNLPTLLATSSEGKSLTLSFSADRTLSAALGAHPSVRDLHPFWNSLVLAWDGSSMTSSSPDTFSMPMPTMTTLRETLKQPGWVPASIKGLVYTPLAGSAPAVRVQYRGESIILNLNDKEDLGLLTELFLMRYISSQLATLPSLAALARDGVPDMLAFGLSAYRPYRDRYGISPHTSVALGLMGAVLRGVIADLKSVYSDDQIVVSHFITGPRPAIKVPADVFATVPMLVQNAQKYLPYIYLSNPAEGLADACEAAKKTAGDAFEVYCFETQYPAYTYADWFLAETNGTNGSNNSNTSGHHTVSWNAVTNLHTILWTFLIILAFLLGTVYMLFAMETGPDTLLYRGSSGANAAPAQAAK